MTTIRVLVNILENAERGWNFLCDVSMDLLEMIRPGLEWWKPPLPKPSISRKHRWVLSTRNWHLPRTLPATEEQQQGRLPSALVKNEPSGAETVDVQPPLSVLRLDSSTLCSRESGGTRLKRVSYFQELISRFQSLHLFISVCAGLVTQFYPTLCDPMDCSPPGSSV